MMIAVLRGLTSGLVGGRFTCAVVSAAAWSNVATGTSSPDSWKTPSICYFDLETTGLPHTSPDIIQIAAICEDTMYNQYVIPRKPIGSRASAVNGLTFSENQLMHHGKVVDALHLKPALKGFIKHVSSIKPVILAAHNGRKFDFPILKRLLLETDLLDYHMSSVMCIDTLEIARSVLNAPKYNQPYLVKQFLNIAYGAHNAIEDVKALKQLHNECLSGKYEMDKFTFQL